MSRKLIGLALAAATGLLAGCQSAPPQPDLALACQTRSCRCLEPDTPLFTKRKEADILWRANGDAYCPEKFILTVVPSAPAGP